MAASGLVQQPPRFRMVMVTLSACCAERCQSYQPPTTRHLVRKQIQAVRSCLHLAYLREGGWQLCGQIWIYPRCYHATQPSSHKAAARGIQCCFAASPTTATQPLLVQGFSSVPRNCCMTQLLHQTRHCNQSTLLLSQLSRTMPASTRCLYASIPPQHCTHAQERPCNDSCR
jgi:hypothetical protein